RSPLAASPFTGMAAIRSPPRLIIHLIPGGATAPAGEAATPRRAKAMSGFRIILMPPLPHERRVAFRNIDAIGSIPDVDKIATESIRFNLQIDIFHSYLIGWRGVPSNYSSDGLTPPTASIRDGVHPRAARLQPCPRSAAAHCEARGVLSQG